MHVDAEVRALRERRPARVNSHSHAHLVVGERLLRRHRRADGLSRLLKRDEELVGATVDLASAGVVDRPPDNGSIPLEHDEVVVTQATDQPRRVLDVGEEERDDAARQRLPGQPATSLWPRHELLGEGNDGANTCALAGAALDNEVAVECVDAIGEAA
jgi:hypothetical protein